MTPEQTRQFVRRWNGIKRKREAALQDTIKLASDIRAQFRRGANGDTEFIDYCMDELRIGKAGADRFLRLAKVMNKVRPADCIAFGAEVVALISRAQESMQRSLVYACRGKVRESRTGTIGLADARRIVRERTIFMPLVGAGAPTAATNRDRLGVLRGWIKRLYAAHNLPRPTERVLDAMQDAEMTRTYRVRAS